GARRRPGRWVRSWSWLLVAPLREVDVFEFERLFVQGLGLALTGVLPGGHEREVLVVSQSLAVFGLVFAAVVRPARLVAVQRVLTQQLAELEEVVDPPRAL